MLYFFPVDILNGFIGQQKLPKKAEEKKLLVTSDNAVVFSLQDWKDHQHICCQSSGGVAVHEDEPITTMDMDKVK